MNLKTRAVCIPTPDCKSNPSDAFTQFLYTQGMILLGNIKKNNSDVSRSEITLSSFCKEILLSYHGNSPTVPQNIFLYTFWNVGPPVNKSMIQKTCFFTLFCSWFKYLLCKATRGKHNIFWRIRRSFKQEPKQYSSNTNYSILTRPWPTLLLLGPSGKMT